MKNSIIPAILLFLNLSVLNSQSIQEWVKRYDGSGTDQANSMTADHQGNIFICGSSFNGNNTDYRIIKYNDSGSEIWSVDYNGTANSDDCANAITPDMQNNIFVTGYSKGTGSNLDFVTIKYNPEGIEQWCARYNGTANGIDAASFIKTDDAGNVIVAGQSYGAGTNFDYLVIKYNSSGIQQWIYRYNGAGNSSDVINGLETDLCGNIYITGASTNANNNFDYVTKKLNSNGVVQWSVLYNDSSDNCDAANSIALDISGNVYITGSSSNSENNFDYLTFKYDQSGNIVWQNRYNDPVNGNDMSYSIAVNIYGEACVTGTGYNAEGNFDYLTIKYNTDGTTQWTKIFNGNCNSNDEANHIVTDANDNIYVTGYTTGIESDFDYTTIKYSANGFEQWHTTYNGTGNNLDQVSLIALDNTGNVYVTGSSTGIGTGLDFATVKYSQIMVGTGSSNNKIPGKYNLSQNYPNPFNPGTIIKFDIPDLNAGNSGKTAKVQLIIFDILGNEVNKLIDKQLNAGNYEISWNASNYAAGIYFYRITVLDEKSSIIFKDTKKMILSK